MLSASRGVGVLEMPAGRAKAKGGKGRSKVGAKKPIAKRRKANVGKKKQREVEDEGWDAEAGKELAARLGSDDDILRHVRKIKEKLRLDDAKPKTLSSLNLAAKFREVVDKDTRSVLTEIERVILDAAASILEGDGLGFHVPSRGASNQHYVQELDRIVLLSVQENGEGAQGATAAWEAMGGNAAPFSLREVSDRIDWLWKTYLEVQDNL